MKNVISTDKAPAAIGPYSQAIEVNGMVYTSGIIPVVPATGEIPEGSEAQAKQALTNLSNLLLAAGTNMDNVVQRQIFHTSCLQTSLQFPCSDNLFLIKAKNPEQPLIALMFSFLFEKTKEHLR